MQLLVNIFISFPLKRRHSSSKSLKEEAGRVAGLTSGKGSNVQKRRAEIMVNCCCGHVEGVDLCRNCWAYGNLSFQQTSLYEKPEILIVHRMCLNENTSHKVVLSTS